MIQPGVDIGTKFFGPRGSFLTDIKGVGLLVSILNSNVIILSGVILLFLIVIGGFMMISGAGSGNTEKVQQGQKAVTAAIIGFIVVFTAYWIVQLIGKVTGIPIINP